MKKLLILLFVVLVKSVLFAQTEFVHTTNQSNNVQNYTLLDFAGLNNMPNMVVVAEQQPDGTLNNRPIGVWYNGSKWSVFNQDRQAMPMGVKFKITFQAADGNAFVITASASNTLNGKVKLDKPELNGNPNAKFIFSQFWNNSVYNNSYVEPEYQNGFWYIKNTNGQAIPAGASFSIFLKAKETANQSVITNAPRNVINSSTVLQASNVKNDVEFDNWSFERGLNGWILGNGNAFDNQPITGETVFSERVLSQMALSNGGIGGDYWKNMPYPIGIKGNKWIGTYEGTGDATMGVLYSEPFKLTKKNIAGLVGGGRIPQKLRVELQIKKVDFDALAGTPTAKNLLLIGDNLQTYSTTGLRTTDIDGEFISIKAAFSARNTEELQRFRWNLPNEAIGKTFRIKILDNATEGWGHINVDDFRFTDQAIEVIEAGNMSFDIDKAVFGFADTHTHPTHDLGFGGKTIVGSAGGDIATEFSNQKCHSMHSDLKAGVNNNFMVEMVDSHDMMGYPNFIGFPKFNSKLHQQQHIDWIKRAYQGGLKLICALGVTNMYWATRAMGLGANPEAAIDDEAAALQQIAAMKQLVANNSSWMGIADSPKKARELILQGKLAVVLGVEMDNFGNFKDKDYIWNESYAMPPSRPLVSLPDDIPTATRMVQNKLDNYYNLGIRQVTPMHYINGVFGGTAQFRYEFALINHAFVNKPYEISDGSNDGIAYNINVDGASFGNIMKTVLGNTTEIYSRLFNGQNAQGSCVGCTFQTVNSTMSATGLTSKGEMMFREIMRKGFLVDVEHSSKSSADKVFSLSSTYNYPILSSHTDPRDLSFKANYAAKFIGSDEEKVQLFGTSLIGNLTHEGMLSPQNFDRIAQSGGTVGVLAFPFRKKTFQNTENKVANDCDGSSKTWCQMYLYSLNKMNGRGVALSTDRGFNDFIAPRFGVWASYRLKDEPTEALKNTLRTTQRYNQSNAVAYANPIKAFHPLFYQNGGVHAIEEDAWKAIAYYHTISNSSQNAPTSTYPTHIGRIKAFIDGLNMTYDQANAFLLAGGATTHERLAGYCVKNGLKPNQLPDAKWHNDAWLNENYYYLSNVWTLWKRMTTSTQNEPMSRCKTGEREWDFNIDGLAHYGLIPDFLQDCKNVGLSPKQLKPLFNSAEDYIRMWEKADAAKLNVR